MTITMTTSNITHMFYTLLIYYYILLASILFGKLLIILSDSDREMRSLYILNDRFDQSDIRSLALRIFNL